jgi:glutathione synthase/RimK-type ligase-like ATP-grasp enzyme
VIEWNSDKRYMRQLAEAGVPIVPTVFVEQGASGVDLRELAARWSCDFLVTKPVVGASSREITKHATPKSAQEAAAASAHVLWLAETNGAALVQPFLPSVLSSGETSVVCIGGEVLFAALKKPAGGDFRVQEEWGGTLEDGELAPELVHAAKQVLLAIPSSCAYARPDFVLAVPEPESERGSCSYLLMEAECIEPELYFDRCPAAAAAMARLVLRRAEEAQ